ncbi:hypothetical protein [Luteolibacter luteus]|uniref:Uncharacterized protein n=1 Tax=Luteolibacter luteus TaxID=2728835 RepID=A0A858RN01_9BACT|nr:hypothetical protein [Luteolibacter luteus]QJE97864.1 hypothetical protein HHL09_19430 [Luteolibacter luteus]
MNPAQFQNVALDILRNYWRIKAACALYTRSPEVVDVTLEYTNVPAVGMVTSLLASEPGSDAMSALEDFVHRRLPRDLLLALIAEFESRLVVRLTALSELSSGTFGQLQRRIESRLIISSSLVEDLDEIRCRRNDMIHNNDRAQSNYVTAASMVAPRAYPYVKAAVIGDNVNPDPAYLTYATDVLIRYSDEIG